jgi:sugar phosphate isomerase/epimerase
MQLGISTYTYGWAVGTPGNRPAKPLNELALLDRASQFGIGVVQFGDNWPLHELSDEQLNTLICRSSAQNILLEVGARGLTDAQLERYIDLAKRLPCRLLRFVIDAARYEPSPAVVTSMLKNALSALSKANLTLAIENHDRLLASEFANIIEQVGSEQVGICLDSVNSMGAGEGLTEIVNTLAPYTVNLHVKDFGIQRLPHLMGFQIDGRPAGQGMLAIPWLVEQVSQYDRCQTAILEQWVIPEPTLTESIAKEMNWAEASINYLKDSNLFSR